jgi:hypothetical protein
MKALLRRLISVGFVAIATACTTAPPPPEIAVGQVWTVKDAPEPSTRVTIERIEPYHSDTVVHVSVAGGETKTNKTNVVLGIIGHMPFEKAALLESIDQLVDTGAKGSAFFEQGYATWKADNGGIFSIPVSQAIEMSLGLTQQAIGEEN